MNNGKQPVRILSAKGQKEIGHIFGDTVLVKQITPIEASLADRDGTELVFQVDWHRLTDAQKALGCRIHGQEVRCPGF